MIDTRLRPAQRDHALGNQGHASGSSHIEQWILKLETKMRNGPIMHIVQHLRPGGLEVMALELARAQTPSHPTCVVSLEGTPEASIAAWPRLTEHRGQLIFCNKQPGLDASLLGRLMRLFRSMRPTCVHTHHIGPLLYAGAAARLSGVRRRIHTEHDAWHLNDRRRRNIARLALAAARPILVADAPHVADAVAAALGRSAPPFILNGVDMERFKPDDRLFWRRKLGLPAMARIIGVAARLEEVKGVDVAIRALARMREPAVLAIAGTGSCATALRALAVEMAVADRVMFLGHIDTMAGFYAAVDTLCLSSRAEGLPLSLLEAQACGIPVVATAVGGVASAVCPASGRLVPSEDVTALAEALDSILSAPAIDPRAFAVRTGSLSATTQAYLSLAMNG